MFVRSSRDAAPIDRSRVREYEESIRALTLREEVRNARPQSTGFHRPAELKAGCPADLSARSKTATSLPCTGASNYNAAG